MLFDSGTTSLVIYTQRLAGSPANAQSPLFEEQETKDAINDAYAEMMDLARSREVGYGVKRSYADTVLDQLYYELPDDFIKMVLVEIDREGNNLSTTDAESAAIAFPRFEPNLDILEMRGRAMLSPAQYYFYQGGVSQGTRHFGIAEPVETAGTKSLRITYEASSEDLSGDSDEPMLPTNHHRLICKKAAYLLRLQNDLPVKELKEETRIQFVRFQRAMSKVGTNLDWQIPMAGRSETSYATQTGFVRKV